MIISKCNLPGEYILEPEKVEDERGFFANSWHEKEIKKNGLEPKLRECNISFNKKKGTIRGLHYQVSPYQQIKLIRCTRGRIFDVALDLRPISPTFLKWSSIELSSENYKMHLIPEGCAHGFQTLEDNSELFYQMTQFYMPKYTNGVKWNDKSFEISWPLEPTIISKKDSLWPSFNSEN